MSHLYRMPFQNRKMTAVAASSGIGIGAVTWPFGRLLAGIAATLLAIGVSVAEAKIDSVRINSPAPGEVMRESADRVDKMGLGFEPLFVSTPPSRSYVEYTIYIARGWDAAPEDFVELGRERIAYTWWDTTDLSRLYTWVSIRLLLDSTMTGPYSFYATVDDGDGPTPPSNIALFDILPGKGTRYETPEIISAESPMPGMVTFTLKPIRTRWGGGTATFFYLYRADGTQTNYFDYAEVRRTDGAYINNALDFKNIDLSTGNVKLTIYGIKSGSSSFYLKLGGYPGELPGRASNIVVVDVKGNNTGTFMEFYEIQVEKETLVPSPVAPRHSGVWPNPASGTISFAAPLPQGDADLRILDIYGTVAIDTRAEVREGICSADISHLPSGSYLLLIEHGDVRRRERFVVVR